LAAHYALFGGKKVGTKERRFESFEMEIPFGLIEQLRSLVQGK
jgi:hypothetical protein